MPHGRRRDDQEHPAPEDPGNGDQEHPVPDVPGRDDEEHPTGDEPYERLRDTELGGEVPCWADRVCPACGGLAEADLQSACPRCGHALASV